MWGLARNGQNVVLIHLLCDVVRVAVVEEEWATPVLGHPITNARSAHIAAEVVIVSVVLRGTKVNICSAV